MTRRRPGARLSPPSETGEPTADAAEGHGAQGLWYAVMIGAVLLIATAVYAAHLYQQVDEWRKAAEQLTIGQQLLRGDRDEILQKVRESEAALATLEAERTQGRSRLEGLEQQRQRLQADVLKLTQDLARSEQRSDGAEFERLERERDRLAKELGGQKADMSRLKSALANTERTRVALEGNVEKHEAEIAALREETAGLQEVKAALEQESARVLQELAERRQDERMRQIIRGHRASLGEVKPFIAEVGPEDWSLIESWLALQLGRPMAIPDLAARGWSYEGARLIGSPDGPPMVMLLYADAEDRPASLTIAPDRSGERSLALNSEGGLTVADWREERHAFFLAGEAEENELEAVGVELLNQPPRLSEDAPVPVSRHVRPNLRPDEDT